MFSAHQSISRFQRIDADEQVIHARSGGDYEIMGVMYGKVRDGVFWIMDAAALPVEGTETRVNAGDQVCLRILNRGPQDSD
jgi:COP9 signalosome complex subunit 5